MLSPTDVLTQDASVLFFIVVLMIIGIGVFALKRFLSHPSEGHDEKRHAGTSVRRRQILTANETAFFRSLHTAVGEQYLIFPQLSLQVLLEGHGQSPSALVAFTNQIDRKRVDFVLVHPQDLRVHLVIEVDDRSHDADHRRRRDGFVEAVLQQAEITLVRIPAARAYAVSTLRQQLGLLDDPSGTCAVTS